MRPIVTLDGDHEVNEVFLTDVRVPAENLVGEENQGWTCAKYLLTYERTNIAGVGASMAVLDRAEALRRAAAPKNGRPLADDPAFAARLARVEIELANMATTNLRVIAAVEGGGVPGAESSMLKIRGTQIRQELTALYRRAMGPYALPFIEPRRWRTRATTRRRSAPRARRRRRRSTSTTASCRSSAAPTRSSATSSRR